MTSNHETSPVILVSGGSRGLGLDIVQRLLALGKTVVTFSRKPSDETEALLKEYPETFYFFPGDLGDPASLKALVKRIEKDMTCLEISQEGRFCIESSLYNWTPPASAIKGWTTRAA